VARPRASQAERNKKSNKQKIMPLSRFERLTSSSPSL
jgi:hypothetical protein